MKRFKKIYIEITNVCNKNCSFCVGNTRKSECISMEKFNNVLEQIKPFTNYLYLHVLGEPLMHPKLSEILKSAHEKGFFVNLTTNATLLKEKLSTILLGNVRQINLSLHSFEEDSAELFESYLKDAFFAVKEILAKTPTIINFRVWNKGQNADRENKIIEKLFLEFTTERDIEKFKGKKNRKLSDNCYLSEAELFEWPSLDSCRKNLIGTCHGLIDHCAILVDGTVVPCCLDASAAINLGNIFKQDFSAIINGEKSKKMYIALKNNKLNEELCQKCSYRGGVE